MKDHDKEKTEIQFNCEEERRTHIEKDGRCRANKKDKKLRQKVRWEEMSKRDMKCSPISTDNWGNPVKKYKPMYFDNFVDMINTTYLSTVT